MFVNLLLSILIFFVPLSFAGTEPWVFFIFQLIVSFIFVHLLFTKRKLSFTFPALSVNIIFVMFLLIAVIQILNHHTILQQKNFIPFTVSPYHTLKELNSIFTYMMFFIVVNQLFYESKKIKKLLYLTLTVSAVVLMIGLCFPKGEYIKFFLGMESLGNFGPFTNRNNAGVFLSMSFFISLALLIYNFLRYQKYLVENKKNEFLVTQIILSIISLLLLISVILTRSRGAMLATFVSVFIFILLYVYHFSENIKQKIYKVLFMLVILGISSFAIYKNIDAINAYSQRTTGISEATRLKLYDMSFDVLKDYPVTGIGFASFPILIDKYFKEDLKAYPEYLHNDWLELLLDVGYPAYAIFLLLIFIVIFIFLRRIKFLSYKKKILFIGSFSACCSICIGSFVDFHFHIPANAMLFFICLATLCSVSFYKDKKTFNFKKGILSKMAFGLLIICVIFISCRNVMAWRYYTFSKNMPKEQEIEYLDKAVKLSGNPKYIENYIITVYNSAKTNKQDIFVKDGQLYSIVYKYIEQYPYNKKISKIFLKMNDLSS